ncbi:MAG: hypothetical protein J3R72DRAFT_462415, partial [Linnemannia gamsii]
FSTISFSFTFVHPSISCLCFPCRIKITTLATIQRKELLTLKKPTTPTTTFASTVRPFPPFFWPENFLSNSLDESYSLTLFFVTGTHNRQKEIKQTSVPISPKPLPKKRKKDSLFAAEITAGRKDKEKTATRLEKGIRKRTTHSTVISTPCSHCASHQA